MRRVALAGLGGLIGGCAAALWIGQRLLYRGIPHEYRGVLR